MAVVSIWNDCWMSYLIQNQELCDLTRKNFVRFRIRKISLINMIYQLHFLIWQKNCTYLHAPEVDLRAGSGITQQNDNDVGLFSAASIKAGNKILRFGKKRSNNGCQINLKKSKKCSPFHSLFLQFLAFLSRVTWLIHTSFLPSKWNLYLKIQVLAYKW